MKGEITEYVNKCLTYQNVKVEHCNSPIVYVTQFILLIIDLITTDKPNGQGITAISKGKTLYKVVDCNVDHLNTYSDFTKVTYK